MLRTYIVDHLLSYHPIIFNNVGILFQKRKVVADILKHRVIETYILVVTISRCLLYMNKIVFQLQSGGG